MISGQIWHKQTPPSFSACYHYLHVSKGSDQEQTRKTGYTNLQWILLRHSRTDNSTAGGPIWPKVELFQDNMDVLVTYKFNSNREKVVPPIFIRSRAAYSVVSRQIWPKFESIQAFMYFLLPASIKRIRPYTAEKMWRHHFRHYKFLGCSLDVQGQITP